MGILLCRAGEQTPEFGMETSDIVSQKMFKFNRQQGK
jgi:hypothetical protein